MTTTEARGRFEAAVKVLEREQARALKAGRYGRVEHYEPTADIDQQTQLMVSFDSKAAALVAHSVMVSIVMELGAGLGFSVWLTSRDGRYWVDVTVRLEGTQLMAQPVAA